MFPRDDAPDLVLRQGQIVTAFDNCVVEAMAVRANRVCAVGSNTYVSSLAGPRTQIVELGGRTVVPGINDSHVHIGFFGAVRPPLVLDVGFPAVRSIAEVAEVVRVAPRKNGWVKGIGWDIGYLDDAHPERSPRRDDLDPVSADTPVALRDFSGHQLWVNSKALELAGISENTPDPNDGLIVRDSDGRPTGILKESAATLVAQIMPPLTDFELNQALDTARRIMHAEGITSVTDAALGPGGNTFEGGAAGERFLQHLAERAGRQDFALRTTVLLAFSPLTTSSLSDVQTHLQTFKPPPNKPGWFHVAGIKLFADGVPPNKTAWMSQQYAGGGCGCLTIAGDKDDERLEDLDAMIGLAHREGHQIGIHVTGDRAIDATVQAFIKPESTDGFVGSAFGAGWPLGWCVCAGRRVLGRAGLECGAGAVGGAWGWAALRGALSGGSDELGQVADVLQGGGEGVCPWPVLGQAQSVAAAVVDEAAWHGEEPVGDGGCDGELARGVGAAEAGGPAGEVVREHAAGEPGAVGGESS